MFAFLKTVWGFVLVASLLANLALGFVSFVLQPVWRAAAVASAAAAAKAKSEVSERKAVAKAKSKEKAKARLRRVIVLIPIAGAGAVASFEYADYHAWLEENPEGSLDQYTSDMIALSSEVSAEVLADLPIWLRPDTDMLLEKYEDVLGFVSTQFSKDN